MSIEAKVEELLAREAIRDCLYRYCRGIDRADEATLRSVYWPDATEDHGAYNGSAAGFVEWAMKTLQSIERGVHQIHNVLIALGEGEARVETYFTALHRQTGPQGRLVQWHMAGRYLDRFERRGEAWRIAHRLAVYDWVEETPLPPGTEAERFGRRQPIGGRFPDDPVYAAAAPPADGG